MPGGYHLHVLSSGNLTGEKRGERIPEAVGMNDNTILLTFLQGVGNKSHRVEIKHIPDRGVQKSHPLFLKEGIHRLRIPRDGIHLPAASDEMPADIKRISLDPTPAVGRQNMYQRSIH